jgi:hypothetical protein
MKRERKIASEMSSVIDSMVSSRKRRLRRLKDQGRIRKINVV